jgi:hypothetical protein
MRLAVIFLVRTRVVAHRAARTVGGTPAGCFWCARAPRMESPAPVSCRKPNAESSDGRATFGSTRDAGAARTPRCQGDPGNERLHRVPASPCHRIPASLRHRVPASGPPTRLARSQRS